MHYILVHLSAPLRLLAHRSPSKADLPFRCWNHRRLTRSDLDLLRDLALAISLKEYARSPRSPTVLCPELCAPHTVLLHSALVQEHDARIGRADNGADGNGEEHGALPTPPSAGGCGDVRCESAPKHGEEDVEQRRKQAGQLPILGREGRLEGW